MEIELIQTLRGHKKTINSLAWARDGLTLGSASDDKLIVLWDPISGKSCQVIDQHKAGVLSLSWSHCKRYLASGDRSAVLGIRDYLDNSYWEMQAQKGPITKLIWFPGSHFLASYSSDRSICIWDIPSRLMVQNINLNEDICDFNWLTQDILLVSFTNKAVLYYLDQNSKNVMLYPIDSQELISGTYRMPSGMLVPNPSSDYIDFCDHTIKNKINSIISSDNSVFSMVPSLKHPHLIIISTNGSSTLWNIDTLEKQNLLIIPSKHLSTFPFKFHPKWPIFAASTESRDAIQIWKVNDR